jgi:hypothetical protein
MSFAGHWWGQGWLWASLVVLIALLGAMGFIARPYYMARAVSEEQDEVLTVRLRQTRPIAAIWIGGLGLAVLIFLMVFKPH